jgi:hypothetical protein
MHKKLVLLLLACAVCVWAADFWTSKPYTDWSSKESQKIMSDSPWAHKVDVELKVTMPTVKSQSEGGRGRGGGGSGSGGLTTPDGTSSVANSGGDVRGGVGGGPAGAPNAPDGPVTQTVPVTLIWQSALPVKQALVKIKYGAEAATSAEAKTFLEREEPFYVIDLSGLPANTGEAAEGDKKAALLQLTALNVKGKDPIHAVEVQITPRGRLVDAVFAFPRTTPIGADDKDVEFSTKFDKLTVKSHFKPKDMVYHGKFEM